MALIPCPSCSAQISDKAKICPKCNTPVVPGNTFRCPECQSALTEGTKTCTECGIDLNEAQSGIPVPPKEQNTNQQGGEKTYRCKWCGFVDNKYSEHCPNCKLDSKGILKPGIYQCKWCGCRSEQYSPTCPKCNRDHAGNVHFNTTNTGQPQIIVQQVQRKRGGAGGIIVFGILGMLALLGGFAVKNQIHSFSGQINRFGELMNNGNDEQYKMMELLSGGCMILGAIFLLIAFIKLVTR